jgi:hypothetical protein
MPPAIVATAGRSRSIHGGNGLGKQALLELLDILRAGPEPQLSRWMAAVEGVATLGPAAAEALPLLEMHMRGADRHLKHDLMEAIDRLSGRSARTGAE